MIELTLVFRNKTLNARLALDAIRSKLVSRGVATAGFELYGEPVDLDRLLQQVEFNRRQSFNLVGHGYEFHLNSLAHSQVDILSVKAVSEKVSDWDEWVFKFAGGSNFVMAWLADSEYQYWQNAEDPLQYIAKGRSYASLPKRSNGLPPPLESLIVDISANPGRRVLCAGYYEVVGAVMWLGEAFWELSGANGREVGETKWLKVSWPLAGVTRIESSETCFSSAQGRDGEFQRRLRSLLFPKSAHLSGQ